MQPRVHIFILGFLLSVTLHTAAAKPIRLLRGRLFIDSPVELSPSNTFPKDPDRYSILADLVSPDHSLSVCVAYAKHTAESHDLADFLQGKVTSYNQLQTMKPHFRWIEHRLIQRDGRPWAFVISFSHDEANGAHVYTRSLTCLVDHRLLDIWVLTLRAADAAQKASVDRLIDSVRLTR